MVKRCKEKKQTVINDEKRGVKGLKIIKYNLHKTHKQTWG